MVTSLKKQSAPAPAPAPIVVPPPVISHRSRARKIGVLILVGIILILVGLYAYRKIFPPKQHTYEEYKAFVQQQTASMSPAIPEEVKPAFQEATAKASVSSKKEPAMTDAKKDEIRASVAQYGF